MIDCQTASFICFCRSLLSDAESGEDVIQYFVCGYFAGYFAYVVYRFSDVGGYDVDWLSLCKAFLCN